MSVFAAAWAYKQRIKVSGAKFVLVALANFADSNGYCFPGQHTIAKMTSLDERTVRSHLKWLEDHHFIRRSRAHDDKGRRTSDDIYLLAPPECLIPANTQAEESPASHSDKRKKTACLSTAILSALTPPRFCQ
ncbi:MAG: helix-turn-helix domain-containing protein [Pyrinomonadaceae bacterium]